MTTISSETTSSSPTNESATDKYVVNAEADGEVAINLNDDTSSGLAISSDHITDSNDKQFFSSETTASTEETIATTEPSLTSVDDHSINGKQMISDNMLIGDDSSKNITSETNSESTEAPIIATIEDVTQNISNRSQWSVQNVTIENSNHLVGDDMQAMSDKSSSDTSISSLAPTTSSLENSTTLSTDGHTSGKSQDVTTESPIKDKSEPKHLQNGTFESVGLLLRGIIDAIDHQLHRSVPTEQTLSNHSTDSNANVTQTEKPSQLRSDEKRGPSLSSSFFITDNNEKPYKLDSDGVEIITAKTAFYDFEEHPSGLSDSILVNLSPSSLKVGASTGFQNTVANRDKNFDVLAQNNRATIYGKPGHLTVHSSGPVPGHAPPLSFPSAVKPSNDWRVVNSKEEQIRRTNFEPSVAVKPIDSLYYSSNIRRNDDFGESSEHNISEIDLDLDKRPRLEFESHSDANNRMKVIPFKVNDALSGLAPKKKNGSFLIRVSSPNKSSLPLESTPKLVQSSEFFTAYQSEST